jgi:thioredoxin reductase (NADPH)
MAEASDRIPVTDRLPPERLEQMFPALTPAQIARVAAHARRRGIVPGEVLVAPGQRDVHFFVVTSGEAEIVRLANPLAGETLIAIVRPGMFTGEVNILSGGRGVALVRACAPGEVLDLDRDQVMALVQTDAELGEILMRAFILRRVELIAQGLGDVIVVGSNHCAGTLRIKEFLTRNNYPYNFVDLDREADIQHLLDVFQVSVADVPVVICRGKTVLRNPGNQELADCLGFNASIDSAQLRDVVIVGAGPAGLAAAVYGASEGLDVLVLEFNSPGGQAGMSSRIENYLGFPTGISGQELASRAYTQALKFGAQMLVARAGKRLVCARRPYAIEIGDGTSVPARSVILATGADYRRPAIENLSKFEGSGVYYGATFVEAQLCRGEEVIVVGGGNSAGQAAMFLAQTTRRVHMLVRSSGLAETMSRYLVRRIEQSPAIELHTATEIDALEGDRHLERVRWRGKGTGATETREIRHVFVMTGAVPSTAWLESCVALDEKGFVKTGPELSPEDLAAARWPLPRPPHLLETSLPGVFAVGDVRSGNVKRVASAVGEGSIAISMVHQVLNE